jgi:hypothetical protein
MIRTLFPAYVSRAEPFFWQNRRKAVTQSHEAKADYFFCHARRATEEASK